MDHAQVFAGQPTSRPPRTKRPSLGRINSLLFCPGTRPDRAIKLPLTGADVGVIDLEDAVAAPGKDEARKGAATAAAELAATHPDFPCVIRINKTGSQWYDDDIKLLAGLRLAGVVLPKVESADDISALRERVDLPIIAGIETALGVTQLERILAGAAPHALYFGAEDLAADLDGTRTEEGLEVLYARSHVTLHARVAGVAAIDQVVVQLDNDDLFERDAATGRSLGYQGKICLHPRQVPLANRIFRPSSAEIAAARRLVAAYETEAASGGGVIRLDGEMVDEPMVRRAQNLLRWVDRAER
jgi:citrate lyase subunit beta/citryl-CoA lyase